MIKDIKLGFSIMKYALNYNGMMLGLLLSMGASVVYAILIPIPIIACLFIGIGVMGPVQCIHSFSVSTMVQSSAHKKKLRTTVPTYFASMALLIGNTMCIGIHWLLYLRIKDNVPSFLSFEYDPETYASSIVVCAVIMVVILVYVITASVFFKTGTCLLVVIFIWFRFVNEPMDLIFWEISTEGAILLSYAIVLVGSFVLYIVNCCIYRFQYSEWTYRGLLKRASK